VGVSTLAQSCIPLIYYYWNSTSSSDIINPCGLVAWSFFNDTYSVGPAPGLLRGPSKQLRLNAMLVVVLHWVPDYEMLRFESVFCRRF
jgi:LEM3 (ligand-effect modulator 3) family / CDC50 family